MQRNKQSINCNKINSNHNSDDEWDVYDLIDEESQEISIENHESSNTIQGQDNQDIILSNYAKMVNQEIERKKYRDIQPFRINNFCKGKKKKIILLYNQPKLDNTTIKASYMKSRIFKQYISHRTKINTQKLE